MQATRRFVLGIEILKRLAPQIPIEKTTQEALPSKLCVFMGRPAFPETHNGNTISQYGHRFMPERIAFSHAEIP